MQCDISNNKNIYFLPTFPSGDVGSFKREYEKSTNNCF